MRVFLGGPMAGHPDWNRVEFDTTGMLIAQDPAVTEIHSAFSDGVWLDRGVDEDIEVWHRRCLGSCIQELSQCDALYLMPGWEQSIGCRIEFRFACDMNMKVVLL